MTRNNVDVPNVASLTAADVVSYFLFDERRPQTDLYDRVRRPNDEGTTLRIDAADFMTNGAGRHAMIGDVPIIRKLAAY